MKHSMLVLILLMLSACAMPGKFEARSSYDTDGRPIWYFINTKNYGDVSAKVTKDKNGITKASFTAKDVRADVVAAEAIKAQGEAIKSLTGLIGLVPGQ